MRTRAGDFRPLWLGRTVSTTRTDSESWSSELFDIVESRRMADDRSTACGRRSGRTSRVRYAIMAGSGGNRRQEPPCSAAFLPPCACAAALCLFRAAESPGCTGGTAYQSDPQAEGSAWGQTYVADSEVVRIGRLGRSRPVETYVPKVYCPSRNGPLLRENTTHYNFKVRTVTCGGT